MRHAPIGVLSAIVGFGAGQDAEVGQVIRVSVNHTAIDGDVGASEDTGLSAVVSPVVERADSHAPMGCTIGIGTLANGAMAHASSGQIVGELIGVAGGDAPAG